jgi:hypothetical protein
LNPGGHNTLESGATIHNYPGFPVLGFLGLLLGPKDPGRKTKTNN